MLQSGFLLTRHSFDTRSGTEIGLWLSTAQGPAKLIIQDERPVFFVASEEQHEAANSLAAAGISHQQAALPLKTFEQADVSAFYFDSIQANYRALDALRAKLITPLEADIRLHDRYLMERFCYGGINFIGDAVARPGYTEYRNAKIKPCDYHPTLSVVSLDLECSATGELYSIAFHGANCARVLMIGEPPSETSESNSSEEMQIQWIRDELNLLKALEHTLAELDPDVIIGWNVVNFDFRLLIQRAEKHGMRLRLGRGRSQISWRNARNETNQGFVTIPGRVVIDGIDALKTATYQYDSFSLEYVAQKLLGRGKQVDDVHDRMKEITHNFHHNKPALAAYNLEDCRLVTEIFEKTDLMDFLCLRSQLTGLELDRNGGSVAAFTNLYLPKLHRAGYVAPNLPADGGLASPGGYVMNSKPGLYQHVLVLDFKSLYPSIIRTFKIDPLGLIEGLQQPDKAIEGFLGAQFSREKHFLPDIITQLWQQRDQAKRNKDAARSQAIKILMNSFYGVLGSGGCRFYDQRLASSITMRGHEIMQQTARWIEQQGHSVIYGDTDSTFVLLDPKLSDQQADEIGKALAKEINQRWRDKLADDMDLTCYLELEYETHYRRFLMPTIRGAEAGSKKRYAGLIGHGDNERIIFKGLETVRTDWTDLAKSFQQQLYQAVFHDEDPSELVRDTVNATLDGKMDSQLVYRKRLRRPLKEYVKNVPPHVRAARMADEQNQALGRPLQYQRRGWISYLITLNGPEPLEYHASPIDYQHYIDKQLKPIADSILPFIELDFDRLTDNQLGLF